MDYEEITFDGVVSLIEKYTTNEDAQKQFILKTWEQINKNPDKFPNFDEVKQQVVNHAIRMKVSLPGEALMKKSSVDTGLGIIYFIASRADIFDKENHMIELDELKKGAFKYVKTSRKGDTNHDYKKAAEIVESLVFDDKIIEAIQKGEIKSGDWVVGMEPLDPEIVQKAIRGEISGASIAGFARMEDIEDEEEKV